VLPNLEHIVEARDALCSGDRDFVIGEDGFGVPVWSFPAYVQTERLYGKEVGGASHGRLSMHMGAA
jgi:hypothetical protein